VLVSAAAGGVGILAVQLAALAGARVIGTASRANHDYLRELGVRPVAYGDSLLEDLRAAAPHGIDVVLDNIGHGTVDAAIALGVPPHRINTIADYPARDRYPIGGVGGAAAGLQELSWIGEQIAAGAVKFPTVTTFDLPDVQDAYRQQMSGHGRGKLILTTR
jgi:NADPH:quinone reductase-like Zn-dependent oxidoreductase